MSRYTKHLTFLFALACLFGSAQASQSTGEQFKVYFMSCDDNNQFQVLNIFPGQAGTCMQFEQPLIVTPKIGNRSSAVGHKPLLNSNGQPTKLELVHWIIPDEIDGVLDETHGRYVFILRQKRSGNNVVAGSAVVAFDQEIKEFRFAGKDLTLFITNQDD